MYASQTLIKTGLFREDNAAALAYSSAPPELSYRRARAIAKAYALTVEDVGSLSERFWKLHVDPILCYDGAASTLLTIHYNLAVGTLARYAPKRKDLHRVIDDLLKFDVLGQFCLTEVAHGLDAENLETTATLQDDGGFVLHSPSAGAGKYMPPTVPALGIPCVAIVFAQLIADGASRGVRPFLVPLNDGNEMCKGVTAKLLPPRGGVGVVNHAITLFERVRLPSGALLGSLQASQSAHEDFLKAISRVSVGTLALSAVAVPALQIASRIALRYSLRRTVQGRGERAVPIFGFPTQQLPVCTAIAEAHVLAALYQDTAARFADPALDPRARHGVATCFKAVALQHGQASHLALLERCGAQGIFGYNQISKQLSELQGIRIAEGDILVLCIRLATELLLGRYALPAPTDPQSLVAQHEAGLFAECRAIVESYGHRSPEFGALVLPRCQVLVEAVGHRFAHEAALARGVPSPLVDLYSCVNVARDASWYVEHALLDRAAMATATATALADVVPHAERWADAFDVDDYVTAPIASLERWEGFVDALPVYGGSCEVSVL